MEGTRTDHRILECLLSTRMTAGFRGRMGASRSTAFSVIAVVPMPLPCGAGVELPSYPVFRPFARATLLPWQCCDYVKHTSHVFLFFSRTTIMTLPYGSGAIPPHLPSMCFRSATAVRDRHRPAHAAVSLHDCKTTARVFLGCAKLQDPPLPRSLFLSRAASERHRCAHTNGLIRTALLHAGFSPAITSSHVYVLVSCFHITLLTAARQTPSDAPSGCTTWLRRRAHRRSPLRYERVL